MRAYSKVIALIACGHGVRVQYRQCEDDALPNVMTLQIAFRFGNGGMVSNSSNLAFLDPATSTITNFQQAHVSGLHWKAWM